MAEASGFATAKFGGEHGTVLTTNPTALYYNPAGLGWSEGIQIFADGTLGLRQASWGRTALPTDPPDPQGAEGANAGYARLFNVLAAPAVGATMRFGDLAVGAGLFVPFGGQAKWSPNDKFVGSPYPLASDGVQRWHGIEGSLAFIYGTVGGAYRWGRLSVGAAANLISSSVSSTQARNPTGSGQIDTEREGRAKIAVSGIHASFAVGLMYEAIDDQLWLGGSYQAQPGLGTQTLHGTLDIDSPTVVQHDEVTLTQALPDIVRLGVRWRPSVDVELRLFGDFTRWSVLRAQCIALRGYACAVFPDGSDASGGTIANWRRLWKDTGGAHLGVSHWIGEAVEVFVGVGFETGATPDSTLEPGLADADNIQKAIGARFRLARRTHLATSYTDLTFMNRNNVGKSELANAEIPSRRPDGGGQYTQWAGILNVNLQMGF